MPEPTGWIPFPDPRKCEFLNAPFGPGVYQVRNRATGELVAFGRGGNCAYRMSSLLPEPFGCGTRRNDRKRQYILQHVSEIEYRCWAVATSGEAVAKEAEVKRSGRYLFPD